VCAHLDPTVTCAVQQARPSPCDGPSEASSARSAPRRATKVLDPWWGRSCCSSTKKFTEVPGVSERLPDRGQGVQRGDGSGPSERRPGIVLSAAQPQLFGCVRRRALRPPRRVPRQLPVHAGVETGLQQSSSESVSSAMTDAPVCAQRTPLSSRARDGRSTRF
jgi:hypothetical protein